MKIAVITCYGDPDHVRAQMLRDALKAIPDVKLTVIKNSHRGLMRYPEVLKQVWQLKGRRKPDIYVLTFRGQEILPAVLLLAGRRPVWFDEFVVPITYTAAENYKRSPALTVQRVLARLSESYYRGWLRRCSVVFADTQAHAELSARVSHMNLSKYAILPTSVNDALFKPDHSPAQDEDVFRVFYYNHGRSSTRVATIIAEAAARLKDNAHIEFRLVGAKKLMATAVKEARRAGAHIEYEDQLAPADLAAAIQRAQLCLGGPFSDVPQTQQIITAKTYEFLACEVPVLVGANEATSSLFTDKQNALIVPQGDAAALARAISWAYKNPAELRQIAANGRKLYEKQFSTSAISKTLEALLPDKV